MEGRHTFKRCGLCCVPDESSNAMDVSRAGTYASATAVTLVNGTSGAIVRYTLDGSEPTTSSAQYTSPISVGHTTTIKAAGFKSSWSESNVNTGIFTMKFGTLSAPTVEPVSGTYTGTFAVTMSSAQSGSHNPLHHEW